MVIALEDAVLDQHVGLGRRAFVVDGEAAAPALDRSVVDYRDARRRDALTDPAGEGAGALAVEIALQPVANRLVQEHARPAWAAHHSHLARRRGDTVEIDDRLAERLVDCAIPGRGLEQPIVEIAAAETEEAVLAPPVLLDHDRNVEANERAHIMRDEAVRPHDLDHAP